MMLLENVRSARQSFGGNKLRTLLSVTGIVIGVASVVAITALGQSAAANIKGRIAQAGLQTIFVSAGRNAGAEVQRLFKEELTGELAAIDGIVGAVAYDSRSFPMRAGANDASDSVATASPEFTDIYSLETSEGRFIAKADMDGRAPVGVLGSELAETLFPDGGAVGKTVRLLGEAPQIVRVVGVLAAKTSSMGVNFDSTLFVPRTTYLTRIVKSARVGSYILHADTKRDVIETSKRVESFFAARTGSSTAVRVMSPSTIAETMSGVTETLSAFLTGIAAVSLLVGGIGIMNIMLVSVTERTKEIGVRKALGATPNAIRAQFLVEAVALTATGGALGVGLGLAISGIATAVMKWTFSVSPGAIALSLFVAAGTGVFFGLYPASRAAKLDPVIALAYE